MGSEMCIRDRPLLQRSSVEPRSPTDELVIAEEFVVIETTRRRVNALGRCANNRQTRNRRLIRNRIDQLHLALGISVAVLIPTRINIRRACANTRCAARAVVVNRNAKHFLGCCLNPYRLINRRSDRTRRGALRTRAVA